MVTGAQLRLALALLCMPWKWKAGRETEELRTSMQEFFDAEVSLFNSGRSALLAALRAMHLRSGEEVIVQAYTCAVVPNAVTTAGGNVVYADIDKDTLNLNLEDTKSKITHRTRAIICQHTFGIPADLAGLRTLCDKHNILLIEDCAHILSDEKREDLVGFSGDIGIASFGRDKAISGVTGGCTFTKDGELAKHIAQQEDSAEHVPLLTIKKYLLYPVIYTKAKLFWFCSLGKLHLKMAQVLGLLPRILTQTEKQGAGSIELWKLPNACAALALQQWNNREQLNWHRGKAAKEYTRFLPKNCGTIPGFYTSPAPLKLSLLVKDPNAIRTELKRKHIYLDDGWSSAIINPKTSDQSAFGYEQGSCPNAEYVAEHILSLPTHPTMPLKDIPKLVEVLLSYLS